MNQMKNSEGLVLEMPDFKAFKGGFFRLLGKDEIFFAKKNGISGSGFPLLIFPVLENGLISKQQAKETFFSNDDIEVLNPESIGISEIQWEN